jgi:hypothetical protein
MELARPEFELTTFTLEGENANHYTMAAWLLKMQIYKSWFIEWLVYTVHYFWAYSYSEFILDLIFVVILQPRMLILTKATTVIMATMATKIMPTIKQFFKMMQALKLDNKLVHQITSIIIQRVCNVLWFGSTVLIVNVLTFFLSICSTGW